MSWTHETKEIARRAVRDVIAAGKWIGSSYFEPHKGWCAAGAIAHALVCAEHRVAFDPVAMSVEGTIEGGVGGVPHDFSSILHAHGVDEFSIDAITKCNDPLAGRYEETPESERVAFRTEALFELEKVLDRIAIRTDTQPCRMLPSGRLI